MESRLIRLNKNGAKFIGDYLRILGIDQSISKAAFVVIEDGKVIHKSLCKTGSTSTKSKRLKSVKYFDKTEQQIHFICDYLISIIDEFNPEFIYYESLSFGSTGNQTRTLSSLLGAMIERLIHYGFDLDCIYSATPQAVKKAAREWLPLEEQFSGVNKNGKPMCKKMEKSDMIAAVKCLFGEDYLEGYKSSGENAGADDIADATTLAYIGYTLHTQEP